MYCSVRTLGLLLTVKLVLSAGGIQNVDTTRDDVRGIAQFAVSTLFEGQNSSLVKVLSASTQLVAGTIYNLQLEITFQDESTKTCDVTVFDQPWTDTRQLTKKICEDTKNRRQLVLNGQYHPVSPSDPVVQAVGKYAVEELERRSPCFADARVESIHHAWDSHVHETRLYHLEMTVCEWPFRSVRIPHPCSSAFPQNLHECSVVVQTRQNHPISLESFHCSGC